KEGRHRGRLLVAEIRSVNHRHCDVLVKLPRQLAPLEDRLKKKIQEICVRGHIDVTVTLNGVTSAARRLSLDRSAARQYYQILKELREAFSLPGEITLSMLAGFRDVITLSEEDEKAEAIFPSLARVVDRAVSSLDRMRKAEGAAIAQDLLKRVATIEGAVDRIEAREVFVLEVYRKKLSQRVAELSGGIPVDPLRLSQEVALFADRSDISEERVRLRTHLDQFRKLLRSDSPVGRTLDFLLQEIHRETNTIGSKANDAKISLEVVGIKTELEKIREQVQNVL
ncbi:MAG TPA: YicC/YloC family endoribonuclease, partial [Nitrospiria bacterium]|nr:YicC/YloC family endoribonuclease [Nitrospiria bacterium]